MSEPQRPTTATGKASRETGDLGRICMDLLPADRLVLGDTGVVIEAVHKSGKSVRLRVVAPSAVRITRERG